MMKNLFVLQKKIEFPILIKAIAGGGGKGMKIVKNLEDLKANLPKCRFEAYKLFGNKKVYIEKFIKNARHIEIQVAGDNHGNVVHFHERDCSVQRNNQKLLEETPAKNVNKQKLLQLKNIVISAVQEMKYNNLCTLEFLFDENNCFHFIEANTRLQVEHPITELVTGYDLVNLQMRIAVGEYLGISQSSINQYGHAIECRINAEIPNQNFQPSTGILKNIYFPIISKQIRLDSYIRKDIKITPFYDSMICKIIAYGNTRWHAIQIMKNCLRSVKIKGINTSIKLQIQILQATEFLQGTYTCDFIKKNIKKLLNE